MNMPDVYEFAVTPKQVWIMTENGPGILRIYTDGREHPEPEMMWPTHTGDSVGHWEGDTLVFDTVSLHSSDEGRTILDRTGLYLSDAAHIVTRMRKLDDNNGSPDDDRGPQGSDGAVGRDQDVPETGRGNACIRLCLRRE